METEGKDSIIIISDLYVEERTIEGKPIRGIDSKARGIVNEVSIDKLKDNMNRFLSYLRDLMESGEARLGAFEISEIEVTAQVTGDGRVGLMGTGVEVGVSGGIKFILTRAKD